MTALEEERINAAAREDLMHLLKEYARTGYQAFHGWGMKSLRRYGLRV